MKLFGEESTEALVIELAFFCKLMLIGILEANQKTLMKIYILTHLKMLKNYVNIMRYGKIHAN